MPKWIRPTEQTKFHIDFEWWQQEGRNFRTSLRSHLCAECQERFRAFDEARLVDWIDVETAEVSQVDGLWHSLRTCCSQKPEYINEHTPLITAIFRTFLANGNQPLTARELADELHRPADTILRTVGGFRVYSGIKPVPDGNK